jgi:hypothetical protein
MLKEVMMGKTKLKSTHPDGNGKTCQRRWR